MDMGCNSEFHALRVMLSDDRITRETHELQQPMSI